MSDWLNRGMLVFDTETTGVDVTTDRIVTATVARVGTDGAQPTTWLIDPGVDIPEAAIAIHGVSTERARAFGLKPAEALPEIAGRLRDAWRVGLPVVAFNAVYDLSIMDAELRRCGMDGLDPDACRPVVDPYVIDRAIGQRRRGKRTLDLVCAHYGVRQGAAHDATEDALAAGRLAWKVAKLVKHLTLDELHDVQIQWAAESASGLAEWMRRKARSLGGEEGAALLAKADGIEGHWPIRPRGDR